MGIMRPLDTAVVKNVGYDLLTAQAVAGEYKEEIGAICSNPLGYKKDYIFLAIVNEIQCLCKAKNDIAFGDTLILDSNCQITNFNEVNEIIMQAVEAEKQDIIDNRNAINSFASSLGPVENDETALDSYTSGEQFVRNGKLCEAIADITAGDALVLNSNYAYADSLSEQISSVNEDLGVAEQNITHNALVIGNLASSLAPVEDQETAQDGYLIGEQFTRNGKLCEAIANITAGDALVLNSNYAYADSLSEQVSSLKQDLLADEGQMASMSDVLGSKNILVNQCQSGTVDKIVIVRNADGTLSISTNGETESIHEEISINNNFVPPVTGSYKLTGGYNSNISLIVWDNDAQTWTSEDTGDGVILSLESNKSYRVFLVVRAGVEIPASTPIIISPMLRLNRILNDGYVPYAMTNQQLTPYAQSQSNPNLLDNPWFTVNQRGQGSYVPEIAAPIMSVDRWAAQTYSDAVNPLVTVNGNGISLSKDTGAYILLQELIEISRVMAGKPYTASLLFADGTVISEQFFVPNPLPQSYTVLKETSYRNGIRIRIIADANVLGFVILGDDPNTIATSATIRAAKLEFGSISTITMDSAPNYAEELLKCQRYFKTFSPFLVMTISDGAGGWFLDGSRDIGDMRTTPTIFNVHGQYYDTGGWVDCTSEVNVGQYTRQSVRLQISKFLSRQADFEISFDVSADL